MHVNWGFCREVRNAPANLEVISKQVLRLDVSTYGEVLRTESCTIAKVEKEENLAKVTKKQQPVTERGHGGERRKSREGDRLENC